MAELLNLHIDPGSAIRANFITFGERDNLPGEDGYHLRFDNGIKGSVGYELFFEYAGGLWVRTENGGGWKQVATK